MTLKNIYHRLAADETIKLKWTENHENPESSKWLDIRTSGQCITIEERKGEYGLSYHSDQGYGGKHQEHYVDAALLEKRIHQLLGGSETITVKTFRELFELTQEQMARELRVNQPAISKMESRSNLDDLLRSFVALGGEIEISAHFPGKFDLLISPSNNPKVTSHV